ncbi:hypothetical protein CANARDRAFT_29495 [[Candida] arabinofermentans NRRL YB-2248]|uniref:Uncharacterized protein n=1 Tax=[Candida] arabinofermentans NRRL YB-2248 TaxID=983967 RepID=A0A1E4SX31_9ASCO|nr:hypothetical protein CANARDRAFT_29495 [[Candida] arabinofermentans NRRL YB-2248]
MTYIGDSTYQFFNRMILFFNDSMFFKRNVNFRNVIPYELLNYDDDDDDGLSDNEQLTVFTTTTNNHKIKRKLSISSHSNKRINSNSKRDILSGTLDSSDIDDAITSANSSPERQQKQEQKQKVKHTDNNNNNMYQSQQQQQQQQQQNNFTSITKLKNLLQQKEITNVYNFPIFLINCKINNLISPPIMNNNNDVNYIIQQELNSNYHDHNQRHKQHKFKNLLLCIAGVTDKEESIELTILSKDVIKFIFNDNNININNYSINELNNKIHQRLTNMIINQTSYNMVIKLHHKKVNYKGDFIKCFKWCYTDYDEYDINE